MVNAQLVVLVRGDRLSACMLDKNLMSVKLRGKVRPQDKFKCHTERFLPTRYIDSLKARNYILEQQLAAKNMTGQSL